MTRAASSPDRSAAPRAVPALAGFGFPVAVVASELDTDGRARTLIEVGDVDEIFPFASVTKPIVAWSALVAVERGLLDLEAPAGAGTAHGPAGAALPGVTVRHLLAHASGIAFDSDADHRRGRARGAARARPVRLPRGDDRL